jgi:hypothetical protein
MFIAVVIKAESIIIRSPLALEKSKDLSFYEITEAPYY